METKPSDVLMVLGDGPSLPSGLARIARELCAHIWDSPWCRHTHDSEGLLELIQLGVDEPPYNLLNYPWRVIPLRPQRDWGGADLARLLASPAFASKRVTLLTVYDPARCVELLDRMADGERQCDTLAGYFAVDAEGPLDRGGFGGPAAAALKLYDHIAAYTGFGARVLRASMEAGEVRDRITVLPHGIEEHWFVEPPAGACASLLRRAPAIGRWLDLDLHAVGCVATNQPRKDLNLLFSTVGEIGKTRAIKMWLHTDFAIGPAWSIPELMETYCGHMRGRVLVTTTYGWRAEDGANAVPWTDDELKVLYRACKVTIAPGLGEGWGYPIVESHACGVPVVGIDYAGGPELQGPGEVFNWVRPNAWRREGPYLLERPVMEPHALAGVVADQLSDPLSAVDRARTQEHTRRWLWPLIWPQWDAWLRAITGRPVEGAPIVSAPIMSAPEGKE